MDSLKGNMDPESLPFPPTLLDGEMLILPGYSYCSGLRGLQLQTEPE